MRSKDVEYWNVWWKRGRPFVLGPAKCFAIACATDGLRAFRDAAAGPVGHPAVRLSGWFLDQFSESPPAHCLSSTLRSLAPACFFWEVQHLYRTLGQPEVIPIYVSFLCFFLGNMSSYFHVLRHKPTVLSALARGADTQSCSARSRLAGSSVEIGLT